MKKYILTEAELRLLLQDQKCLEALQAYGVDNWDGYEEAINDEEYTVTAADFEDYNRIGIAESKDVYCNYNWDNECRNG
jgi:hypothetical protein